MKFFVPHFRDQRETSEYAWLTVRGWQRDNGRRTTRRRVQALVADIDGVDHYIAVGHPEPFEGETVLLILESSRRNRFHICTLTHGLDDTPPWTLPLDEHWRVVEFE
jgi:hypothetical protein